MKQHILFSIFSKSGDLLSTVELVSLSRIMPFKCVLVIIFCKQTFK